MNDAVSISLDGHRRTYQPGEILSGEYRIERMLAVEPSAVELSVLWHTEGQGDEDLAVHHFERWSREQDEPADFRRPRRFQTCLPNSPLSYQGVIVKIRWCVRVRVFLARGKPLLAEQPFQLGSLTAASAALPVE
ncbi:MAG: hypothetical protein WD847_17915 [Pirellulales bacterium]